MMGGEMYHGERIKRAWGTEESREPTKQRDGDQPLPTAPGPNDVSVQAMFRRTHYRAVPDAILDYSFTREAVGIERYGSALFPNNGRYAVQDAFEESFDLVMYLIQMEMEGYEIHATVIPTVVKLMVNLWEMMSWRDKTSEGVPPSVEPRG